MNPSRYEEIREIFKNALQQPEAQRARYLEKAVAQDTELQREVVSLLAAHQRTRSFLLGSDPETEVEPEEDLLVGRMFGPYEAQRLIGRGGMGAVYVARRADQSFRMRVAIKVVAGLSVDREMTRRFHLERQILAGLNHPNIARLLDGGETEEGLPYLVMEYVEGQSIDEFCRSRRLSIRERIELFLPICSAVHYAHQNLIVHRDLKPRNILVTADGVPKLLDFGIAKLLKPEFSSAQGEDRETTVMTPEYASPEQILGEPISTASDVYALGILLYELLSGCRPFQEGDSSVNWLRAIEPSGPELMSDAVLSDAVLNDAVEGESGKQPGPEPKRLSKRLQGDLDNIVAMAMRREPQRRYSSVEKLAADLKAFLSHHEVAASGRQAGYRLTKLVRRHRLVVGLSALLLLTLIGFCTALVWHQKEVAAERDHARLGWAQAREVRDFLTQLFEVANPKVGKGPFVTAQEILDEGERLLQFRLADQPRAKAELLAILGNTYNELGRYEKAEELLEKALVIRLAMPDQDAAAIAHSHQLMGRLRLEQGRYEESERYFRQALSRQSDGSTDPGRTTEALSGLALALQHQGDYSAAEEAFRESSALRISTWGASDPRVAEGHSDLAGLFWYTGRPERAEPRYREALRVFRSSLGRHPKVAYLLNDLGNTLANLNQPEEAEQLLREALDLRREMLGSSHPRVATSLNNLASLIKKQGRYEEAEQMLREVVEIRKAKLEPGHRDLGLGYNNLGAVLLNQGKSQEAEAYLKRAEAILKNALGPEHPFYAFCLKQLSDAAEDQHQYRRALDLLLQARRAIGDRPEQMSFLAATYISEAKLHRKLNQAPQALEAIRIGLEVLQPPNYPPHHRRVLAAHIVLAGCLLDLDRFEEAAVTLRGALETIDNQKNASNLGDLRAKAEERLAEVEEVGVLRRRADISMQ